jgi:putative flippase GtrA
MRRVSALFAPFQHLVRELTRFGLVGLLAYVIDVGVFNALIVGPLSDKPLTSKGVSTLVAATASYFMNRHWTWSHRARTGLAREYSLFILLSAVGLAITVGALGFGEYVLDQDSLLARNVWGNVVGVGLASVWRFWSFKRWVFPEPEPERTLDAERAAVL